MKSPGIQIRYVYVWQGKLYYIFYYFCEAAVRLAFEQLKVEKSSTALTLASIVGYKNIHCGL